MKTKNLIIAILATLLITPTVLAASTTYYASTTVYFNVPADASFSITMPSGTTYTITGTAEGTATSLNWISFNFTNVPQSTLQEPYELGDSSKAQQGALIPIFYIDNTGNTDEKFEIRIDSAEPSGIYLYFNATCTGTCTSPTTSLTRITTSYQPLVASLPTTSYLNVTLYANVSSGATAGETSRIIYIRSVAV